MFFSRSLIVVLLSSCFLIAQPGLDNAANPIVPKKKLALFNGKDLDGWYTWLRTNHYQDPEHVYSVQDGAIRISGTEWGGLTTHKSYKDYRLIVEYKWGGPTHGDRATKARDSGIMLHARGKDGAYNGVWLNSIEAQIIEGGTGDFLMVGTDEKPSMTVDTRTGPDKQHYWQKGGTPVRKDAGRFNWYARDVNWKDQVNFRGAQDVEKPVGQWNRFEIICDGATVKAILNGKLVNEGYSATFTSGKIQFESEGAEIWIRRVELLPLAKKR
ncbi:hypothetical protein F183_A52360 [Bryobacterales bacterium F-183]|nr:hypothetical protein F183_A52360 [Bryobacterales bacterium F-183]